MKIILRLQQVNDKLKMIIIRIELEFYTYTSTVQVLFSMKFQNNFESFCSSKIRIFYSRSTNLQGDVHMKRAFVFKLVLYNFNSLYAGINNLSLHILGNASIEEINIQVKIKQCQYVHIICI